MIGPLTSATKEFHHSGQIAFSERSRTKKMRFDPESHLVFLLKQAKMRFQINFLSLCEEKIFWNDVFSSGRYMAFP